MNVKAVELATGEDRASRIVGIGEIDYLCTAGDRARERLKVVAPVAIEDGSIGDPTRFRQHLKSEKSGLGGQNFVLIAQKRAHDVGHDALRPASGDHVFRLCFVAGGKLAAQTEAAGGIEIQPSFEQADSLDRQGRRSEGVFVRSQLDDSIEREFAFDFLGAAARLVRLKRLNVRRNQRHAIKITAQSETRTNCFPVFAPLSMPMKARGAFSRPSSIVSSSRSFPSRYQAESFAKPSAKRGA